MTGLRIVGYVVLGAVLGEIAAWVLVIVAYPAGSEGLYLSGMTGILVGPLLGAIAAFVIWLWRQPVLSGANDVGSEPDAENSRGSDRNQPAPTEIERQDSAAIWAAFREKELRQQNRLPRAL